MMKYLIYTSRAINPLAEHELKKILAKSRLNNAKFNLTGVMLYFDNCFIQILEGMDHDVDKIFKKIIKNNLHNEIIKIADNPLQERNFPDWPMGFSNINENLGDKLAGYIAYDGLMDNDCGTRAINLLKILIERNKISISY